MGERVVAENCHLDAVLRSCSSAIDTNYESSSVSENPLSFLASLKFEEEEDPFSIFNIVVQEKNNGFEELQDAYTNITSKDGGLNGQQQQEQVKTGSPDLFVFGEPKNQLSSRHVQQQELQPEQQDLQQKEHQHHGQSGAISLRPMQCQPPRCRKRKYPQKRIVCHVTVEDLSGDLWGWRKYGQKPIKGSPYPRNYYRCSSSKGCAARKQVERSSTDPNIFIVSYTGDHTHARPAHRHSLAGITRSKFSTTQTARPPATNGNASCFSPASSTSRRPTTVEEAKNNQYEKADVEAGEMVEPEEEDDEDDLLIPNLAAVLNDDIFKGLEELSSCVASGGSCSNSRGGEVG